MRLLKCKKGKFKGNVVNMAVLGIIIIIVLFAVYAAVIPEAQTAGDAMGNAATCANQGCFYNTTSLNSTSGILCEASESSGIPCATDGTIPLNSLFSSTGVVFVIVMAALFIIVLRGLLKKK